MSEEVVLYEHRDPGIALITLNRPDRLNAWNGELAVRYFALLDRATGVSVAGFTDIDGGDEAAGLRRLESRLARRNRYCD